MARSFNGSSDLIDMASVNWPSAVTLSCWAKPSSLTPAYSAIFSRSSGNVGTGFYQILLKSSGQLAMYVATNPTTPATVSFDPGTHTLSTGTWYHLALVYSSTVGLIGYVNGASDGTGAANSTIFVGASTVHLQFGNDQATAGRNFGGSIADGCQWNVALTATEISALANGARPYRIRPGSIDGYWPLNGLVSPEPDLSGKAHNGTLTGTALAFGPPIAMFTPRWPQVYQPPPVPSFFLMPQIIS